MTDADAYRLQVLGEAVNYNGYGDGPDDLFMAPLALYRAVRQYADPLAFAKSPVARRLDANRRRDIARAERQRANIALPGADVYILPDTRWARRVRGAFANRLARGDATRAHAVLTWSASGGYTVSVRAPLAALANAYPSG
ncbi:hypothetical protein [Burkholderia territorii]|uniref:hypothetical protein n=1 Tax=Burkholderia territorii TaxID=1503055 RepID=UPI000ACC4653|nr:hypothetical protein [Burkholderia territorii]